MYYYINRIRGVLGCMAAEQILPLQDRKKGRLSGETAFLFCQKKGI